MENIVVAFLIGVIAVIAAALLDFVALPIVVPLLMVGAALLVIVGIFLATFAVVYGIIALGYVLLNLRKKANVKKGGTYTLENTKNA